MSLSSLLTFQVYSCLVYLSLALNDIVQRLIRVQKCLDEGARKPGSVQPPPEHDLTEEVVDATGHTSKIRVVS